MQKNISLFFSLFFLAQASAWAFLFDSDRKFVVPALTAPVVDQAKVISSRQEEILNQLLRDFQQRGKAQISVLTVESLHGLSIEEASIQVTDQWKLGTEKKDNGILILVSVKDRKARIEVGQGLEGTLPDVIAKRILSEVARPYFKKNLYGEGLHAAIMQIMKYVDQEFVGQEELKEKNGNFDFPLLMILLFIVFPMLSFFSRMGMRAKKGGWGGPGYWGGGGGWGGGSGGGGWSGGGGGFSGGGASDGW